MREVISDPSEVCQDKWFVVQNPQGFISFLGYVADSVAPDGRAQIVHYTVTIDWDTATVRIDQSVPTPVSLTEAVDPATGRKIWNFAIGRGLITQLTCAGEHLRDLQDYIGQLRARKTATVTSAIDTQIARHTRMLYA